MNEIVGAFRVLAKRTHPDKGGAIERFKLINNAYEVLSHEGETNMMLI